MVKAGERLRHSHSGFDGHCGAMSQVGDLACAASVAEEEHPALVSDGLIRLPKVVAEEGGRIDGIKHAPGFAARALADLHTDAHHRYTVSRNDLLTNLPKPRVS